MATVGFKGISATVSKVWRHWPSLVAMVAMVMQALKPWQRVGAGGLVMHVRPVVFVLHTEHRIAFEPVNTFSLTF